MEIISQIIRQCLIQFLKMVVANPGLIRTMGIMISIRFLRTLTTSFQITVMPLALGELA